MNRDTRQKRAVREALGRAARPLSPLEALELARQHVPGLGLATVYRALHALVAGGEAAPVALPGEPPRYERAGLGEHAHFVCDGCRRVYDLEPVPAPPAPPGFESRRLEVVLHGLCAGCNDGSAPARGEGA